MTLTMRLMTIKADWLRVPAWALWYPLVLLPDFTIRALLCAEGRARIVQAKCWENMLAFYIVGLDGWPE